MKQIIFQNKYFLINSENIVFSILLLAFSIVLILLLRKKLQNANKKKAFWLYPLIVVLLVSVVGAILMPDFFDNILWKNKVFNLSPWRFSTVLILIFTNLFLIRIIKNWIENKGIFKKRSAFFSFSVVLWAISVHFSIKLIVKNYSNIIGKPLFHISKVGININDLFFLVLSIALTFFLILTIRIAFERMEKRKKIDKSTSAALQNIMQYFIWTLVIILLFQNIGFNITALLAGSAALLVGVGLGVQQLFNDFASGIILLTEQKNRIGDFVEADEVEGNILEIGFRTTTILTRDNIKVIIPNSKLVSQKVINWTKGEKYARIGVDIGVAYGSDLEKVKKIILEIVKEHKEIIQKPKPEVMLLEFGDSSLNLKLYFYTSKVLYREKIISDLLFSIYSTFNQEGVVIPFPQVDVHYPDKEV